jgi:hypothetical protein
MGQACVVNFLRKGDALVLWLFAIIGLVMAFTAHSVHFTPSAAEGAHLVLRINRADEVDIPAISMSCGIIIYMFFFDDKKHHHPHIHAH